MSDAKPLNLLALKYQALAVGALGVGAALVSEVFASSVGASGLIHPVWHGLYSPADAWKLLSNLDRNCIVQPAIAHFHNTTVTWVKPMSETHCPHAAAIASLNTRLAPWAAAALAPPLGFLGAASAAAKIKPGGRVLPGPKRGKGHVSICIGKSTGALWQLGLDTGLKRKQKVWLTDANLSQDMLVVGGKGVGKALAVDTRIVTPTGFRLIGDIRVGDQVIGRNGKPTTVLGVYPQGVKPGYRVTFSDGVSTICCDEHLWAVSTGKSRFATPEYNEWRHDLRKLQGKVSMDYRPRPGTCKQIAVRSLAEIRERMAKGYRPETNGRMSIPLTEPVEFEARQAPLDPYLLGVLIGDGCMSLDHGTSISSADQFVIDEVSAALASTGTEAVYAGQYDYRIVKTTRVKGTRNPVSAVIRGLGLQVPSYEKFIPEEYKFSDVKTRIAVLQGLFDTDGSASKACVDFSTTSKQLADDVVFMVQSLGGLASMVPRITSYTHKGEIRKGRVSYRIHARLDSGFIPFRLPRKIQAYRVRTKDPVLRHIERIEPVGDREMVCIAVDAPDHLYVVDGFVVTHNTSLLNAYFLQAFKQGCGGLFLNVKGDYDYVLRKLAKRAGRTIRTIGIDGESVNLMDGVTPQMASTYIQTSLRLVDKGHNATFWSNIASNLSRGVLRLLSYFKEFYTLPGLRRFLFDKEFREFILTQVSEAQERLKVKYPTVTDKALREEIKADDLNMASGLREIDEFNNENPEVQRGVLTQLSQILSGMCEPEMEEAFFNTSETAVPFDLRDTYEKATIFVINAPMAFYGASARAAQAWVKFRFYSTMDQRRVLMRKGEANSETIVIFGVDEVQSTMTVDENTSLSDDQWLATSRDTKTACVWATQSIPALRKAAGGVDSCDAVMANLRHQMFFRSEDIKTVRDVLDLMGTAKEKKESTSKGKGGKSTSESEETRAVAHAGTARKLKRGQAFFLADIDGESADDIIETRRVYA
jgi:hypothetical protein